MNNYPTEAEFYCDFIRREVPLLEDLLYNTDIEPEAGYEYATQKLAMHFAPRFDTDEIRDLLAQDPEVTGDAHSLASLYFAQAADELQKQLIENSAESTGGLIGPIIGIKLHNVKTSIELYRALPKADKEAFREAKLGPI